jgi:hypothetical protein
VTLCSIKLSCSKNTAAHTTITYPVDAADRAGVNRLLQLVLCVIVSDADSAPCIFALGSALIMTADKTSIAHSEVI